MKKDKIFFFASYEGQRYTIGAPRTVTEPNTANIPGSFGNSFPAAIGNITSTIGAAKPNPMVCDGRLHGRRGLWRLRVAYSGIPGQVQVTRSPRMRKEDRITLLEKLTITSANTVR